ncbi:SIR2 family NAD-dependent protein deacylase [Fulvivirga sediminis]|uniref:NAD-dependent protein deacylase n=1 Tax=Fulvivirga sediminis TaxID=2803949 RepID=A0A937F6R8_9BACT|nr:NAD-dependent deacylase [Fulvivirga sediminis]MBL3655294.1 NAD-dependent deacylase [Fulvivirga sediminis]
MSRKPKVVVLTGAGISAESGIPTFRDADGLWEGHDVMEVASPQGWKKNRELVLDFYNQRRKAALHVKPNEGHMALVRMEEHFDVTIITQNIDNLHEKAGSSKVLHLHGQLFQSRSTLDENLVYDMDHWELKVGDKCEKGSQLRPNVVWFGEMVPMMEQATKETYEADYFIVVGTSLYVYPAAGLLDLVDESIPKFIVDRKIPSVQRKPNLFLFEESASSGVERVRQQLVSQYI